MANPLATSMNKCAMDLFYLYGENGYNRVFSPFAVNSALLSLYVGAAGTSEQDLRSLYSLTMSQNMVPLSYYEIYKKLDRSLFLLNSFWVSGETEIRSKYQDTLSHYFKTTIFGVDILDVTKETRRINAFALSKLNKQVEPFVKISGSMSLLSVNGLAYALEWLTPFYTKYSSSELFYPKSGATPTATRMMSKIDTLNYYENENFQVVSLPLKRKTLNNHLEVLIYLPKPHISNDPFETAYNQTSHFLTIPSLLKPKSLHLQLPTFEFQMNASMSAILSSLETQNELTPSANFSLISGKTALFLSDMLTTTKISVNEFGVGITNGLDEELTSSIHLTSHEKPLSFIANRPFLYVVRDVEDDLILTMGAYTSPVIAAPPPPPEIRQKIAPLPPPPSQTPQASDNKPPTISIPDS